MELTDVYFDPLTWETFLVAPKSLHRSYVHVGAEGHLLCQWSPTLRGWARRRKRWVFIEKI